MSVFVGIITLIPSSYAKDANEIIRVPFSKITPVLDGKFTSEKEWNGAKTINFQSNGYDFYLLAKQDERFVYLMFDGVDFQANPKDNSTSVRYQAVICLDNSGTRPSQKQAGIACFISTENNEFGKNVMTTNAVQNYTEDGKSKIVDGPDGYNSIWGFGNKNDPFEETDHLMYEVVIPKKSLSLDFPGFSFIMYFDSAKDNLVQLTDGVIWPPDSDKDKPLSWGALNLYRLGTPKQQTIAGVPSYKIECGIDLELIFKDSDNSPVCVTAKTKQKLTERSWVKQTQAASDISHETMLKLTTLLENGKVSEFNELRKEITGQILIEKIYAPRVNLSGINLEDVALPGANLENANLIGANLRNVDLSNANLQGVNLENISSYRTKFWNANLQGANLQNSKLNEVYFKSTDLSNANLQGADLESGDLPITVNLQNTDLRNVKNLPISIEEAKERGAIVK